MASIRRLAFRDRFVWNLEQVVSTIFDDCDGLTDRFVFPDMTTRVPFVMLLSQEQFTTLYSAVLTGADLAFPNTSHDVENLFLQMVTCPMNEFCAALINCLENDPDVWAALNQLMSDNGMTGGAGNPDEPLSSGVLEGNLLPVGYTCTDDLAFGMALAIANSINQAVEEVLQAIEVATNPVEIASELADNVPGIGLVASAGDVAAWVQNTAQEEYALAWSDTVRDELACDIWCLILEGCSISLEDLHSYYLAESLVAPPAGDTLEDWMLWLIAIVFGDPKATVATISMMGLSAMRFGGGFGRFALGINSLETTIALAQDDSSSDWSILCDPCLNPWCYNVLLNEVANWDPTISDFPCGQCDLGISTTELTGCLPCNNSAYLIETGFPLPVGAVWDSLEIDIEWNITRAGTSNFIINADGSQIHSEVLVGSGAKTVVLGSGSGDIRLFFWLQALATNAASGAYANITRIHLIGDAGTPNLFGVDDC